MKAKALLFTILSFLSLSSLAQIEGYWKGTLELGTQQLEVGFDMKGNDSLSITLDVPAQGAFDIPAEGCFKDNILTINISSIEAKYQGTLNDGKINGTFTQNGMDLPLELAKSEKQQVKKERSQDPKEPYGYVTEDVFFENTTDGITLAGTLTIPQGEGPFPAVVLVSGSGTQNRNEEMMNHRPFLVIADYLTRHGIAVLRYDDRGFAPSQGDASTATSADLANDAQAAFDYLMSRKETDQNNIGIIGHSEGGMINFMVAAREPKVAFIISLAGPAVKGSDILKQQKRDILKAQGFSDEAIDFSTAEDRKIFDIVEKSNDIDEARAEMGKLLKQDGFTPELIEQTVEHVCQPWMYYFIRHDPTDDIVATQCPALLMNGTKDLQVSATQNLTRFKKIAKQHHKKNLVIRKMKGLNHFFQHCDKGLLSEYIEIDETIAPEALEMMRKFIVRRK